MVRAVMIVEMAGRPAEHLKEAIEKHIGVLNGVSDIEVHSIKVSEPKEIVVDKVDEKIGEEKMFTCFAEADFECPSFGRLSETMFDFMPSSVEVVEPGKISMSMVEATDLLNNISGRMHRYDEIAKVLGERYRQMSVSLENVKKILVERDATIASLSSGKSSSSMEKLASRKSSISSEKISFVGDLEGKKVGEKKKKKVSKKKK